ncbi:probable E3 ubiquitin-protein ligase DTX2 isoform X2 [Hypanus sabinus]|uniref:probable E3 ubiquitin-protein ligase DTX2 isoform X2 n=1 Tax=Hypanus sabinus TaxID=79690 RepID=UPI0028C3D648|nr:probable E3 ubiquitin-protein ligase DTX2 isoform X2 [Hypanus sabinus]
MAASAYGNGAAAAGGGGGGGGASSFPIAGAVAQGPQVVVWEWEDEAGHWRPYSSRVSEHVERSLQQLHGAAAAATGKGTNSIALGQADPWLAPYIIDIPTLTQFRQDTGRMRRVRRQLYSQSTAPGQGLVWQWENDEGGWTAYETVISIFLEGCFTGRQQVVDLGNFGYNYVVDLASLCQINKSTGFRRRIQRCSDVPYPPPISGPLHRGHNCSCHQCLAYAASGPILNRSRHTPYNLAGPSQQTSSRSSQIISPNHGYFPYSKRPVSVGPVTIGNPQWPRSAIATAGLPTASNLHVTNSPSIPALPIQLNGPTNVFPAFAEIVKDPEEVVKKYMTRIEEHLDEDCIICMEKLNALSGYDGMSSARAFKSDAIGKFGRCGHVFHLLCMMAMYENGNKDGSLQCPSCKTIYGEKTGTQPKGRMDIYLLPQSLPGYPDTGSIQIVYNIPHGIQGPEHPNPGKPYTARGFPRHCYLPYNEKGRQVLELLKVAWNRRLIFTVGTSSTTGETDTVVWNEIHHKTEKGSNVSGHGFPDPNYLDNVLGELAAQGVTVDCLRQ